MTKVEKVEVFSDRTYYIVSIVNNEVNFELIRTKTLSDIINALKAIKNMNEKDKLIACCYQEYEGSFNIEVNPNKQFEEIYKYGMRKYKTFETKAIENNLYF